MLTARLRRVRDFEVFRFGTAIPSHPDESHGNLPYGSGFVKDRGDGVRPRLARRAPDRPLCPWGRSRPLGAARVGDHRGLPSLASSASATNGGTIWEISPPRRATSMMPDERRTKYFWSVGRKTVSIRESNARFMVESSNS